MKFQAVQETDYRGQRTFSAVSSSLTSLSFTHRKAFSNRISIPLLSDRFCVPSFSYNAGEVHFPMSIRDRATRTMLFTSNC